MARLINLGNTCAINSTIQSIHACNISIDTFDKPPPNSFAKSLFDLLHIVRINHNKIVKPTNFIKKLYCTFSNFPEHQQLDAQELWTYISNQVFKDTAITVNLSKTFTNHIHRQAFNETNKHNYNLTSHWNDIFQGTIINISICNECGHKSYVFEPFFSLSMNNQMNTVDMFKEFFKTDITQCIHCDNCKKETKRERMTKFYKLPQFLVISINRYNNLGQKVSSPIDINQSIKLSNFALIYNKNNISLDLISCVNHYGDVNSGHYTCFNFVDKKIIDDTTNIDIDNTSKILKQNRQAYIVFYKVNINT